MRLISVQIKKLHGIRDFTIYFEDNTMILVAENGSGKTTIVNMIYFFLSRQWGKLNEFHFKSIIVNIDDNILEFEKQNVETSQILRFITNKFPLRYTSALEKMLDTYTWQELRQSSSLITKLAIQFDLPPSRLRDVIINYGDRDYFINNSSIIERLDKTLQQIFKGIQILYLPTYRRIERDLNLIFPNLNSKLEEYEKKRRADSLINNINEYIELVEFGMDDVKEKVENVCSSLKNNFYNKLNRVMSSYLEDILDRKYAEFQSDKIMDFDANALDYLMKRLDNKLIGENGKRELQNFVERIKDDHYLDSEDKIKAFFVWKLLQVYEEQKTSEILVNDFVAICNQYISNGKFLHYDKDTFEVGIKLERSFEDEDFSLLTNGPADDYYNLKIRNAIEFNELSSGEKQIISLFSHIIFSKQNYFIIIDEPELSLSVPWQYRFLPDIRKLKSCSGLLAVTHSPFIYNNDLQKYSHSLEEFYF